MVICINFRANEPPEKIQAVRRRKELLGGFDKMLDESGNRGESKKHEGRLLR
jgi:hypothetical protein